MERDRTYSRVGRVFHFACALAILLLPGVALGRVSSASPFTHAKKCEFFRLAAFSMVNFREQGKTLGYGMRMVAFQLSIYKALSGEGPGEGPGLEAEYTLGLAPDVERMGHDIWTVKNFNGEPIPRDLVNSFVSHSCGWPVFDWH